MFDYLVNYLIPCTVGVTIAYLWEHRSDSRKTVAVEVAE